MIVKRKIQNLPIPVESLAVKLQPFIYGHLHGQCAI